MDHLSCSQINLYLHCPLKYKFKYIDNLPPPFKSSALAFGGALHAALAWLHRHRMNGGDVPVDLVYKVFEADWYAERLDTKMHFKNGETEAGLTILGKEMLSLYFVRPQRKPVAAEVPFTLPLVNLTTGESLDVNLEGYIDLIEEGDSITEFKTSAQTMSQADVDDHLQLTAYSYAYKLLYRREPRALKLVDFVKTKRPKIVPLQADPKTVDYERFFHLACEIRGAIRIGVFFPRRSFMCRDCEYAGPCRSWRGN